ncbi:MAG: DsbA family protein [Pseudomonadota bacterium]
MRHFISALAVGGAILFAPPAFSDEIDFRSMSAADRDAFGAQVRAYLLENPEVIFEAIQILEARRNAQTQRADQQLVQSNAEELFNDGYSYVGGNPEGDITVVEFLDYRCGFCKRAHPEIAELLRRDPNVRLVVKEFPILGPDSVAAGRMALAALDVDRGRYKALGDELMGYRGNLTEQVAYRLAGDVGFDIAALKERAGSPEIEERLQSNYQLAQALGLKGTPAFVVGTEVIRGYLPVDDMLSAVQDARSELN